MPNTLPVPRKRRTREHVIADLSVNHLERFILEAGHTAERQWADYGYDLAMTPFDANGYLEPGRALFQLKAAEKLHLTQDGEQIVLQLDVKRYTLVAARDLPGLPGCVRCFKAKGVLVVHSGLF